MKPSFYAAQRSLSFFLHQCPIPPAPDSNVDRAWVSVSPSIGYDCRYESTPAGRTNRIFKAVPGFCFEPGARRFALELAACLAAQADGPEKVLIANIDRVLECLSNVSSAQRELLTEVLNENHSWSDSRHRCDSNPERKFLDCRMIRA